MHVARMTGAFVLLVSALACHGPDVPLTNHDGCVDGWQEGALPPHDERLARATRRGDVLCVDEEFRGDALTAVDVGCKVRTPLDAKAVDHQTGIPFGGIAVEFYLRDIVDGTPAVRRMSNEDGTLANVRLPSCTPLSYVATGDPDTALPTHGHHVIFAPGATLEGNISSVAGATVAVHANMSGIALEPGTGSIFGRAIACDDRVLDGVHVVLRDGACRSAQGDGAVVGYTLSGMGGLVDPTAIATSADGSFFVLNAPPGSFVLDLFETTETGSRLLGSAPVVVTADEVSVVDVRAGRTDGVRVPESCFRCE
jgi:hypothetical protein